MSDQDQQLTLENIIQEKTLRELFNCTQEQLSRLRSAEGLPFVRISKTLRVYLEPDLMRWLAGRKVVLNKEELKLKTAEDGDRPA